LILPFAVLPALVLACGGGEAAPPKLPEPTSAKPAASATLAAVTDEPSAKLPPPASPGVDAAAIDPNTPPCDDFYQYACGGWLAKTEIPSDESSWSRSFHSIRERNEDILKGILERYAKGEGKGEPYAAELGALYGSCMDEAGADKAGVKPIEPLFKQIDAIKDAASLTKTIGALEQGGIGTLFGTSAAQDFGDATKVVGMVWQGGLGMPEREYYLDGSATMTELRAKYEQHVAAMMKLAGEPEEKAKAAAKKVLEIETAIAQAWMSKEDRREPKKLAHHATKDDLAKLVPSLRWNDYLDGASASGVKEFNVAQPEYMKAVAQMIDGKVSLPDMKTYLRWHVVRVTGDHLSKAFVDERFRWKQALMGAKSLPPRWKRCVRLVDGMMGEALGQPFVKTTLGTDGKAIVSGMIQGIEKSMQKNLDGLVWMDDATRKAAYGKLGKIANKIAYPDKWRDYSKLKIDRDLVGNVRRGNAFEHTRQIAKIGKPVDRGEWQMSPPAVNAYYDPQLNEMVFPAGILQPPFYANKAPQATNYGAIGMVMGHELTHGFDDEGRQFDAEGNLRDWWSTSVNEEFERRASCVQKQYDDYVVLGDVHVNGKLTLGENIADLGGVKLAFKAMRDARASAKDAADPKATQLADQEFFLGFGQGWCSKYRDEAMRTLVATNPHSPPHLRVNGPLSNLPEFAQAFQCTPRAKLMRKNRCEVW
jgi:predicted metalloendopeptidase